MNPSVLIKITPPKPHFWRSERRQLLPPANSTVFIIDGDVSDTQPENLIHATVLSSNALLFSFKFWL